MASFARRAPEHEWQAGVRLIDRLSDAVEVPPAPPPKVMLSMAEAPTLGGARMIGIPFDAEANRPFVVRMRIRLKGDDGPRVGLRALGPAEAARIGKNPVALSVPLPGTEMGTCYQTRVAEGWVVCQRLDHLRRGDTAVLLVIEHPELGVKKIEVLEAENAPARAPRDPNLRPLVRHMPDLTPTGVSYRTSLIAPPGGTYAFDVALPPRGELMLATGLEQSTTAEPVRFIAKVDGAVVLDEVVKDIRWRDHRIALPDEPGRKVRIELRSEGQTAQRGLWANPRVLTRSPDAPSILFITLDAVRPDHLSAYGYPRDTSPALAHIASSGARFDKVVAQSASTWQSVLSLLSGRHPIRSGVRQAGDRLPPNVPLLPDLLAARGYDTFAGSDNAAFPAGQIARFDEEEINVVGNSNDLAAVTEREMRMMAKRMAERPTFAWFHIENAHYPLLPAQPLRYDPGYEGRFKLGFSLDEHWTFHSAAKVTPAEQKHIVALYDAGIRDADDLVKQMILLLDEVHATENTILVITADHGEHLGERDLTLEHSSPWEQVLRVPLIIAWLGHLPAGVVVSQRAQLIDLVPTLLGLAGLPPAADLDGRDLSPLLRGEKLPEAPAYSEPEKAIYVQYRGDEKLILNPGGAGLRFGEQIIAVPPRELYDLASDPQEARDLVPLDPKRAADAEAALLAAIKRLKDRGEGMHGAAPGQAAFTTLQQAGYLHLSQPPAVAGKVER